MAIQSKMKRGPIGEASKEGGGKQWSHFLWIGVIVLLILAAVFWFGSKAGGLSGERSEGGSELSINPGEYQAVFLDNAQVYFGKLEQSNGNFFLLTDVYYLQTGSVGIDQISNLSLTKLGNEAHGPEDRMEINKDHILFIEDMKPESKVVRAILEYKSNN